MDTSTTPTVDDAIDFLATVEVAPGRNAYYADETGRYYIVTDADLELLATYLDRTTRYVDPIKCDYPCEDTEHEHGDEALSKDNAYSHWCADTQAVEMPAWWTLDRQTAYRMRTYPCCGQLPHGLRSSCTYHLEHGKHEPVVDELLSPDESEEFDAPGQADGVDVYPVTIDFSTGKERHPGR